MAQTKRLSGVFGPVSKNYQDGSLPQNWKDFRVSTPDGEANVIVKAKTTGQRAEWLKHAGQKASIDAKVTAAHLNAHGDADTLTFD